MCHKYEYSRGLKQWLQVRWENKWDTGAEEDVEQVVRLWCQGYRGPSIMIVLQ